MIWRRVRKVAVVVLASLLFVFCIVAWVVGGKLVAPKNFPVGDPPTTLPLLTTTIESESGSALATWYLDQPESVATLVLLHPNGGSRRSMLERAELFCDAGYSLVMIDFRGHGESQADSITFGHLEKHDVVAAVEFARKMDPTNRIGVVGRSLGGAAALLASPLDIDALVLESVYPTLSEAVYNRVGKRLGSAKYVVAPALLCQLYPRMGFSPSDLRPIDYVDQVGCPIFFAAGDADLDTPMQETLRMFNAASDDYEIERLTFDGAKHEDLYRYEKTVYQNHVLGFFEKHLGESKTQDAEAVLNEKSL